jgi:hypothetical protein
MYSATSIINALRLNTDLTVEGIEDTGCPLPKTKELCSKDEDNCEKGNNQDCKQPIIVYKQYKKLTVLTFMYKVSKSNRNGFIRKDDSTLKLLINRNDIDKSLLKEP